MEYENTIIDYSNLDKIISSNSNYISAALISLQFIEHSYNSISIFDKRTNKHLYKILDEYIDEIYKLYNSYGEYSRYLPKDNYQVLLDFCIEHINQIIKKPKELLIKEAKMIRLNKIEYVTPRTIVYLSKKPGETIKEKLSNSRTLLADKKRFTTNIKENQCTLYLLKKLEKIASDRIKNGVENNLYHINDEKIKKTLDKIINLRTNLKKYSISEAVEKTTSIANNALLSHKNYSVIWKSINYLKDFNLLKRIENIKYRFICLFQLSILSMFSKYSHIIYNDVFSIEDDNSFTGLKSRNKNIDNYSLILKHKTSKHKLLKVNISINKNFDLMFNFDYMNLDTNKNIFKVQNNYKFVISFNINEEYKQNRGLSFTIGNKSFCTNGFADFKDFKRLTDFTFKQIEKIKNIEPFLYKKKEDNIPKLNFSNLILDFTSYDSFISLDGKDTIYLEDLSSIVNIDDKYYLTKDSSFYNYNNILSFNSIYDGYEDNSIRKFFEYGLKKINETYNFDNVINLMPDSISEIDQSYIRKNMNNQFNSLFYVWRSVAAVSYYQMEVCQNIKENFKVLVIDLLDFVVSATKLEFTTINRNGKNFLLWKHYPISHRLDDDNILSFNNICKLYLKIFNRTFKIIDNDSKLNFLLERGIVAKILKKKISYTFNIGKNIYLIDFNNDIFKKVIDKIKNSNDIANLKKHYNTKVDSIIYISNNFYANLKSELNIKKDIHYFSNKELSLGASYIYSNWIKYKYSWIEYLPSLSLEVIKGGRYHLLELISDNTNMNMGESFELDVKESLILPCNQKEIKFPLIKDIKNKGKFIYAFIRGNFLPLSKDVVVRLKVKYKYGYDDSYELVAYPTNDAPFEYINLKFDTYNKVFEDKVIDFNNIVKNTKEHNFSSIIKYLNNSLNFFKNKIDNFRLDFFTSNLIKLNNELSSIFYSLDKYPEELKELYNRIYNEIPNLTSETTLSKIKNINKKYIKVYSHILNFLLIKYCILSKILLYESNKSNLVSTYYKLLEQYWNSEKIQYDDIKKALATIGLKPEISNFYYASKHNLMKNFLKYLLHKERDIDNINVIINFYKNSDDDKKRLFIYHLGIIFSHDIDLLRYILKYDRDFVSELKERTISNIKIAANDKEVVAVNIRSYLLMLFHFLMLRDTSLFNDLKTGSQNALELSNYIKKIDDNIYNEIYFHYNLEGPKINKDIFNSISILQFNINNNKLYNMCNLTYVTNALLTGDDGGNTISVIGVVDDE